MTAEILYIAGSSAEIKRAEHWRDQLVKRGIKVASTWMDQIRRVGAANPRDASWNDRDTWSCKCLSEVRDSGAIWFLVPTSPEVTRGGWFELGYANAIGDFSAEPPAIICSGDTRQSIFCALGDEFETDEQAFASIVSRMAPRRAK